MLIFLHLLHFFPGLSVSLLDVAAPCSRPRRLPRAGKATTKNAPPAKPVRRSWTPTPFSTARTKISTARAATRPGSRPPGIGEPAAQSGWVWRQGTLSGTAIKHINQGLPRKRHSLPRLPLRVPTTTTSCI